MSDHGVVAIQPERLDAFAAALLRVADDLLEARLGVLHLVDAVGAPAPAAVLDLGQVAARLRELGLDTRRRLDIVRRLPWDDWPLPTSIALGRDVGPPFAATVAVRRLLAQGRSLRPHEVADHLDPVLAASSDPFEAAAALQALGIDGFRRLYALADRESHGFPADEREQRFADRAEAVTGLLFAASATVDRPGGLPRAFVDALLPGADVDPGTDDGDGLATVSEVLTAAGAGQYLVAATQRAVTGGVGSLVVRAGRVVGIAGAAVGILEGMASGGTALAAGVASGVLGLVGTLAGGPVGWVAAGLAVVVTLLSAPSEGATPPRRTYPSDGESPGGHGSETYLNGAGIPVAPAGA